MRNRLLALGIVLALVAQPTLGNRTIACTEAIAVSADSAPFYRTELFFGLSIPGGGRVSDDEWSQFTADVITSRFPDGFTIIDATGQYKQKDDQVIREPSKVIVFLYPVRMRTAARRRIEEIRRAYVRRFKQESVLRVDYPRLLNVTF